jgi:hypothetical protein
MVRNTRGIPLLGLLLAGALFGCSQDQVVTPSDPSTLRAPSVGITSTTDVPFGALQAPSYVRGDPAGATPMIEGVVRVYQDEQPWFGSNRAHTTLISIGKVLGTDYFIHPLIDLQQGIPDNTELVVITSNSFGDPGQAQRQNHPAAQAALADYLRGGGKLIVDMGDNLPDGGFIAPGADGTPALIFPDPCDRGFLTPEAQDHPFRTAWNTLTDADVSHVPGYCSVAHGNLEQGITLPDDALPLITAIFGGTQRIIMAEYCYEGVGRVILDTMTKEFAGFPPEGEGPSTFMQNLFAYGLSEAADCDGEPPAPPIQVEIRRAYSGDPPRAPGTINLQDEWVYVEILDPLQYRPNRAGAVPFQSPGDVRIGPSFAQGTPAESYELVDLNNDGNLDIRLRWSLQQLVNNGHLSAQTTQLRVNGVDPDDGQRYFGTVQVRVVLGDVRIDQNQPSAAVFMAAFAQTDLAQSFQTQQAEQPTAGAGIFLQPGVGSTDNVTIQLWDALPNAGGTMLRQGSAQGTQGQWVDVLWAPILLEPNQTYYLVFTGNNTLGIAGDINNPYPHGHVFANPGFGPFPTFDYTFRTWVLEPNGDGIPIRDIQRMRTSAPSGIGPFSPDRCSATAGGGC